MFEFYPKMKIMIEIFFKMFIYLLTVIFFFVFPKLKIVLAIFIKNPT